MGPILMEAADQGELFLWKGCKYNVRLWAGKGYMVNLSNRTIFIPFLNIVQAGTNIVYINICCVLWV